jgi:hypothetical protein
MLVQSKAQLWRFVAEIGISPLLAALKKSLKLQGQAELHEDEASRLRADAAEALLHLMNVAMDLVRESITASCHHAHTQLDARWAG